jgi:hypothetical protein
MPDILDILVARCQQDHTIQAKGKGKAKGKATDSAVEDNGRALQLRVLISGELPFFIIQLIADWHRCFAQPRGYGFKSRQSCQHYRTNQ